MRLGGKTVEDVKERHFKDDLNILRYGSSPELETRKPEKTSVALQENLSLAGIHVGHSTLRCSLLEVDYKALGDSKKQLLTVTTKTTKLA